MSWTEERIDRLREYWTKGMTASQIAEELGGVSRNAVIGKAHRLGLQARPSPVKANEEEAAPASPAEPAAASPAPQTAPAPRAAAPAPAARAPEPAPWEEAPDAPEEAAPAAAPAAPQPQIRSIGPGGFLRQGPGDQQPPIPPAPPRRLVPAKPSPDISDKTSLLDLNEKICKWPIGHPGEPDFHFCGRPSNPGFPIASTIAASLTRRSSRAATADRRRRCRSAARASAEFRHPLRGSNLG
jgi:GcrA cell cycle regulator